jgi:hypothetical protein
MKQNILKTFLNDGSRINIGFALLAETSTGNAVFIKSVFTDSVKKHFVNH